MLLKQTENYDLMKSTSITHLHLDEDPLRSTDVTKYIEAVWCKFEKPLT